MEGYYTHPAYPEDFFKTDKDGYLLVLIQKDNQFSWQKAYMHVAMITPDWAPIQEPGMVAFLSRIM